MKRGLIFIIGFLLIINCVNAINWEFNSNEDEGFLSTFSTLVPKITGLSINDLEYSITASNYYYRDYDEDGWGDIYDYVYMTYCPTGYVSTTGDCIDTKDFIHPGAAEICNWWDDDCDPSTVDGVDEEAELNENQIGVCAGSSQSCVNGVMQEYYENIATYETEETLCDGLDNDCDGEIDEILIIAYVDSDGDNYGVSEIELCGIQEGYALVGNDCDDTNALINPGMVDLCNNFDDDCDSGTIDGADEEGPKNTLQEGVCFGSRNSCTGGVWVEDYSPIDSYQIEETICDTKDNDCDGLTDEELKTTFYRDLDSDSWGNSEVYFIACTGATYYVEVPGDCNDGDSSIHPEMAETCNYIDDDCNDEIDEGVTITYYPDLDGDTFGYDDNPIEVCEFQQGYSETNTDCDDSNDAIFPGNEEICNQIDDDCNGKIDEGVELPFYADTDGDGYGNDNIVIYACEVSEGFSAILGDCDDSSALVYPGANEICNNIDDDCDNEIDENVKTIFFKDLDGDSFGDIQDTIELCAVSPGYSVNSLDCDDTNANTYPGAIEICNGVDDDCDQETMDGSGEETPLNTKQAGICLDSLQICQDTWLDNYEGLGFELEEVTCDGLDNDCDSEVDEGLFKDYYKDNDGDLYGDSNDVISACVAPTGYVGLDGDCDDNNVSINPSIEDTCNGVDDNCDGIVDDAEAVPSYRDADGDNYGDSNNMALECFIPVGFVELDGDCNDNNIEISPAGIEICNNIDDDCNMSTIDGSAETAPLSSNQIGVCKDSIKVCNVGIWVDDYSIIEGYEIEEVTCDTFDNDCDGITDDDAELPFYLDSDGDSFGNPEIIIYACELVEGYSENNYDCNDSVLSIYPGAKEFLNDIDDDCDSQIDEEFIIGDKINSTLNLSFTIDGEEPGVERYSGKRRLEVYEDGNLRLSSEVNLSMAPLILSSLKLVKINQDFGAIEAKGFGENKTIYVDRIAKHGKLCIKDREEALIIEMTPDCTAQDETGLNCPGVNGQYSCVVSDDESYYIVSGLNHSAVREQTFCGDGVIQSTEVCEATIDILTTCEDLGFGAGDIVCNEDCQLNTNNCSLAVPTTISTTTTIPPTTISTTTIAPTTTSTTSSRGGRSSGGGGGGFSMPPTTSIICEVAWTCSAWTTCSGKQSRDCSNQCNDEERVEHRDCNICDNNIMDGTEVDVDCGGTCSPCSDGLFCRSDSDCLGLCNPTLNTCFSNEPYMETASVRFNGEQVNTTIFSIQGLVVFTLLLLILFVPYFVLFITSLYIKPKPHEKSHEKHLPSPPPPKFNITVNKTPVIVKRNKESGVSSQQSGVSSQQSGEKEGHKEETLKGSGEEKEGSQTPNPKPQTPKESEVRSPKSEVKEQPKQETPEESGDKEEGSQTPNPKPQTPKESGEKEEGSQTPNPKPQTPQEGPKPYIPPPGHLPGLEAIQREFEK